MTEFSIGRFADDDYRLYKWDGSTSTEVAGPNSANGVSGWSSKPGFEKKLLALFDHHGVGNSPFSERQATIDSLLLSKQHVPITDKEAGHSWPWE